MNKELLLRVADVIEMNPEHFFIGTYLGNPDEKSYARMELDKVSGKAELKTACDTCACIAGFTLLLHEGFIETGTGNIGERARKALELSNKDAMDLFFQPVTGDKGNDYRLFYEDKIEYAKAAKNRIINFIGEKEKNG